jgi:light-regulated signal transduction histidine kinase (bacteriophytochrome)
MISSYVELIARRYAPLLDDEGREFIAFASDGASRMQRMIDDLLAFARERIEVRVAVDMTAAVDDALAMLGARVTETQATVKRLPVPDAVCDPRSARRIWQNLIANSLTYRAPERPLSIEIGGEEIAGGRAVFYVQDNGVGIPSDIQERVFGLFQQVYATRRSDRVSTGLGLSMCRHLVDSAGGRIWIESDGMTGTRTCFELDVPVDGSR